MKPFSTLQSPYINNWSSGFRNIEIIDLDTIDVSNLNRQFLFQVLASFSLPPVVLVQHLPGFSNPFHPQKQHVGQAKSHCAREAALRFAPGANIKVHSYSLLATFHRITVFIHMVLFSSRRIRMTS